MDGELIDLLCVCFDGITTSLPIPRRTSADALKARDIGSYSTRIGNIRVPFMDAGLLFQPWVEQKDIAKQRAEQ